MHIGADIIKLQQMACLPCLACLIPSSFLRVGDHGHSHRRSPLIPVSGHSCTLRQWPPRPVLDVVQPASSWMTSVSLAIDSSLEYMSAEVLGPDNVSEILQLLFSHS